MKEEKYYVLFNIETDSFLCYDLSYDDEKNFIIVKDKFFKILKNETTLKHNIHITVLTLKKSLLIVPIEELTIDNKIYHFEKAFKL